MMVLVTLFASLTMMLHSRSWCMLDDWLMTTYEQARNNHRTKRSLAVSVEITSSWRANVGLTLVIVPTSRQASTRLERILPTTLLASRILLVTKDKLLVTKDKSSFLWVKVLHILQEFHQIPAVSFKYQGRWRRKEARVNQRAPNLPTLTTNALIPIEQSLKSSNRQRLIIENWSINSYLAIFLIPIRQQWHVLLAKRGQQMPQKMPLL